MKIINDIVARMRVKKGKRHVQQRELIQPMRHWTFGFLGAVLLFVSSISYIAIDFYEQIVRPSDAFDVQVEPVIYKESDVVTIDALYDERAQRFAELRTIQYAPTPHVNPVEPEQPSPVATSTEVAPPLAEVMVSP